MELLPAGRDIKWEVGRVRAVARRLGGVRRAGIKGSLEEFLRQDAKQNGMMAYYVCELPDKVVSMHILEILQE